MKLEIVKIGEQYALRKTTLFFFVKYKDLDCRSFWWGKDSIHFKDCLGTKEQVKTHVANMCEEVIERIK